MADRMGPSDFFELVKSYARQEVAEPLSGVGRWLGAGVMGSILLMIGGTSLTLALLRVLQEETGSNFTGNWSWAPYGITLGVVFVILGLLGWRISKRSL